MLNPTSEHKTVYMQVYVSMLAVLQMLSKRERNYLNHLHMCGSADHQYSKIPVACMHVH